MKTLSEMGITSPFSWANPEAAWSIENVSREIFEPWHYSFGDQWASINFYLQMSINRGGQTIRVWSPPQLRKLHEEIRAELDSEGKLEFVDDAPTKKYDGYSFWETPFFPTKRKWNSRENHLHITFQFDGISSGAASPQEEATIFNMLRDFCPHLSMIKLGKHLSVSQCVDYARNSLLFVGVDSGMSHLVHSVGTPLFLLEYHQPVCTTHRGKAFRHCAGSGGLFYQLERWFTHLIESENQDSIHLNKGPILAAQTKHKGLV